jgi:hypothetical protein
MANAPPTPGAGQMFSLEDRPDYMLEAFLDEQNILVKPLLLRRLGLLTALDLKAQLIEKQVQSPPSKKQRLPAEMTANDKMLQELLELSDEKITIAKQLQDIAFKQLDTLLEVEAALEAGVKREREENPSRYSAPVASSTHRSSTSKAAQEVFVPQPLMVDDEPWCICRQPDDGRPMVACDNPKCALTWWHVDCVADYIATKKVGTMADEKTNWFCPICSEKKTSAQSSPSTVRKRKD